MSTPTPEGREPGRWDHDTDTWDGSEDKEHWDAEPCGDEPPPTLPER